MSGRLCVIAMIVGSLLSPAAAAAPAPPHIVDPAGDAVTREASYDITAVRFSTERTARGKTLVIRLAAVAPVTRTVAHHYQVTATLAECRFVAFANFNEAEYAGWQLYCEGLEPRWRNLPTSIEDGQLVWRFVLSGVPAPVRTGAVLTDLAAASGFQEIWTGRALASIDDATGDSSYRIG